MIRNYFKIAWRNIERNKLYSFINIGGLALGLMTCVLIMLYVSHEHSYDQFHKDSERIYKMGATFKMGGETYDMQKLSAVSADLLGKNTPDVEATTQIYEEYKPVIVKNPEKRQILYSEPKMLYADANFFNFFSFNLIKGQKANVLNRPFSIIMSESMGRKYFGEQNPIGKVIEVKKDSTYQFTVTGIVANTPSNSSIDTRVIASISSMEKMKEHQRNLESQLFQGGAFDTYVKLKSTGNKDAVIAVAQKLNKSGDPESAETFSLFPLVNQHLDAINSNGVSYLNVFPFVAVFILILALLNYISLSTARATTRAKEVGVRKVNGARRRNVTLQFYIESAVYVTIAFALAVGLSIIFKNSFFNLLGVTIDTSFYINSQFFLILSCLFVFSIFGAGLYPAIILSSFKPIDNLKSQIQVHSSGNSIRKICTTTQFSVAVILLVAGIIIRQQLNHLQTVDTGLNRLDILMLPLQKTMGNQGNSFRNDVENIPGIKQTTMAHYPMYKGYDIFFASTSNRDKQIGLPIISVDENFINTLEIKWKYPPKEEKSLTQSKKIVINQAAIEKFGFKPDPRGEHINFGKPYEIIGVVKDFNYSSLSNSIGALGIFIAKKGEATQGLANSGGCLFIKFDHATALPALISKIKGIYKKHDQETPFSYQFMDDAFNTMFKTEERLAYMFDLFIVLTIIIAGLGLLGLATFTAQQRIKEIGIRKVLGATIGQIATLLSKDFLKLVLIANLIATPLAWYLAHRWLQDFAYRIQISWWIFAMVGLITLGIALLAVGYQIIKAAMGNPVKSLRTE